MAQHGNSGRIVIDVDPDLKRRFYASLNMSGSTLKDWFMREAEAFYVDSISGLDKSKITYKPNNKTAKSSLRDKSGSQANYETIESVSSHLSDKFKVISMFSGCGGMDLGFKGGFEIFGTRYKSLPFETIWANDLNAQACNTYKHNLGDEIRVGDVWALLDTLPSEADVIIGGFPCQDISVNGKRAGVNGARSGLYRAMIEAIKRVKPKVFVAENVKALLKNEQWLQQVVADFKSLGYILSYQLYQAADYGVPQTRERVIFVGTAPGVKLFEPPKPERNASTWMTAREALADLESLEKDAQINHIWSEAARSPEQGNRRLISTRPGYTIRAECHGNIQFHYSLPRRISMREAARIQSFPDKFHFASGLREIERQVGNAVPPVLAWNIAKSVLESLTAK